MPEGRDPLTEEMSPFYVPPKPSDYYKPSCDYEFSSKQKSSNASSSSSGLSDFLGGKPKSKPNTKDNNTALYDFIGMLMGKHKKR